MPDRNSLLRAFLDQTDWAKARVAPLAGDASNRRYLRLTQPETNATAVLMDSPPEKGEDVRPFVRIARYLTGIGLSAPRLLAADESRGFLLLEDLGDDLFARIVLQSPDLEQALYETATDLLVHLHEIDPPTGLETYDASKMTDMAALAFDWYAAACDRANETARAEFSEKFSDMLRAHATRSDVLIQRDYHAENLLWLPGRSGVARVGLLDFQDAMLGHPAYDLVSLLQDARRDVPPALESAMITRYITQRQVDDAAFTTAYHCLGAQRNLRIIGVFVRLCLRDGKAGYLKFLPRVWLYLRRDLKHPALAPVAELLERSLPAPEPEILNKLEKKCATVQHP